MHIPLKASLLFAVGITFPVAGAAQNVRPDSFLDSHGVRIRYLVRGSGPPVLLIHGFSVNIELGWAGGGFLDSLATRYTVIALDQRGHGASDKPHDPAAYGTQFVEDIVRLLDHLRIRRAHVIGYSMGGLVTLNLMTRHPERVASAVLGGYGWRPPELGKPDFIIAWTAALDRAARGEITVVAALLGSDSVSLPPPVAAALNRNDPRALAAVQRGDSALLAVTEKQLRSINIPVLAVVGESDDGARADVERSARLLPAVEVMIVPGANHLSAPSHPLFLHAIRRFLDSH